MFYVQVLLDGGWSLPVNVAADETFTTYEAARDYTILQGHKKEHECVSDCVPTKTTRRYWRIIEQ